MMKKHIIDILEIGDRVRDLYSKQIGTVLGVRNGKYTTEYYEGEQYNPYRIIVRFDNSTEGLLGNGTVLHKAEYLEKL